MEERKRERSSEPASLVGWAAALPVAPMPPTRAYVVDAANAARRFREAVLQHEEPLDACVEFFTAIGPVRWRDDVKAAVLAEVPSLVRIQQHAAAAAAAKANTVLAPADEGAATGGDAGDDDGRMTVVTAAVTTPVKPAAPASPAKDATPGPTAAAAAAPVDSTRRQASSLPPAPPREPLPCPRPFPGQHAPPQFQHLRCRCDHVPVIREVRKPGGNCGRLFFCCPHGAPSCDNFADFLWVDEAVPRTPPGHAAPERVLFDRSTRQMVFLPPAPPKP